MNAGVGVVVVAKEEEVAVRRRGCRERLPFN